MKSERIAQTFNGQAEWRVPGSYFKLLSTVNPVTVRLFLRGTEVLYAADVEGGFYQRIAFDQVQITTGASEAVAWMFAPADGGSDRFTGSVTVSGTPNVNVSDRAARLLGIVYGTLGQAAQVAVGGVNALQIAERGCAPGANFAALSAIGATTNETVVAPASNTAGLIVWRAGIAGYTTTANAGSAIGLLAKASAPSSGTDGELLLALLHNMVQVQSGSAGNHVLTERPRYVAAGKGLYFRNSGSAEASGYRFVDYTLL